MTNVHEETKRHVLKKGFLRRNWRITVGLAVGLIAGSQINSLVPKRSLTPGEKTELSALFGKNIDVDRIRIGSSLLGDILMHRDAAATTSGSYIRFKRKNMSADFSKESTGSIRDTFYHEAAHVWQFQNCKLTRLRGIVNIPRLIFAPEGLYDIEGAYAGKKDLLDYNIEQQANLIADHVGTMRRARVIARDLDKLEQDVAEEMRAHNSGHVLDNFVRDPGYIKKRCR